MRQTFSPATTDLEPWPVFLFKKSVLKQNKLKEIFSMLGEVHGCRCLDLGSDNGVVSYFLRKRGGDWASGDLEGGNVDSIGELVHTDVHTLQNECLPFADNEFDKVAVVDLLEHLEKDEAFLDELYRILKPNGELIINTPYLKNSLLRKFRIFIGQTDERHGHVRPGYNLEGIRKLLCIRFEIVESRTYSKFFSEAVDTLIQWGYGLFKGNENPSSKGTIVTADDLGRHRKVLRIYSLIYPILWLLSKLDGLLFFTSGYLLIVKAKKR